MRHVAAAMLLRWARLHPEQTKDLSRRRMPCSLRRARLDHAVYSTVSSSQGRWHSKWALPRAFPQACSMASTRVAPFSQLGLEVVLQPVLAAACTARIVHTRPGDKLYCAAARLAEPPTASAATSAAAMPQSKQLTKVVLIAVDPDTRGAIAVGSWDSNDLADNVDVHNIQMELYDMPCQEVLLKKKSSVTGKHVKRTWLDVEAACKLVQQVLQKHVGQSQLPHMLQPCNCLPSTVGTEPHATAAKGKGRPKKEGMHASGLLSQANSVQPSIQIELRAIVESSPTMPFTSRPSTIAPQLHSVGAWHGILAMAGFKTSTVPASTWKHDMSLMGLEKEGSLALAKQLWPHQHDLLARKKDHGRAEALLIAAWAMGASRPPPAGVTISASALRGRLRPRRPSTPSPTNSTAVGANGNSNKAGVLLGVEVAKSIVLARAGVLVTSGAQQQGPSDTEHEQAGVAVHASPAQDAYESAGGWSPLANYGEQVLQHSPPKVYDVETSGTTGTAGSTSSTVEICEAAEEVGEDTGKEDGQNAKGGRTGSSAPELDRKVLMQLIEERSDWDVVMGPLRSFTATDGYGNALPQVLEHALMPVEPRRRLVLGSSAAHTDAAAKKTLRRASRGQPSSAMTHTSVSLAPPPTPLKPEKAKKAETTATAIVSAAAVQSAGEPALPPPEPAGKVKKSKRVLAALTDHQDSVPVGLATVPSDAANGNARDSRNRAKSKK